MEIQHGHWQTDAFLRPQQWAYGSTPKVCVVGPLTPIVWGIVPFLGDWDLTFKPLPKPIDDFWLFLLQRLSWKVEKSKLDAVTCQTLSYVEPMSQGQPKPDAGVVEDSRDSMRSWNRWALSPHCSHEDDSKHTHSCLWELIQLLVETLSHKTLESTPTVRQTKNKEKAKDGKPLGLSPQTEMSFIPVGSLHFISVSSTIILPNTHLPSRVQGALELPESIGILSPCLLYTKKDNLVTKESWSPSHS